MQNLTGKNAGSLARTLGADLLAANKKVATVESCTGGGVAYAITEVAGSSQWFDKSWVTYSNEAKHEEVGVNLATLAEYGAVSSEVVREMAQGGLRKSGADLCVSISGIAGPGGGTKAKPVGLVWFAIATLRNKAKDKTNAERPNSVNVPHSSKVVPTGSFAKSASSSSDTSVHYTEDKTIYTRCFSRCFSGDRQQVREQAINLALKELIVSLVNT